MHLVTVSYCEIMTVYYIDSINSLIIWENYVIQYQCIVQELFILTVESAVNCKVRYLFGIYHACTKRILRKKNVETDAIISNKNRLLNWEANNNLFVETLLQPFWRS